MRREEGVTVIELMGLIALLAVLSALAAQQYKFLRARAQESAVRGDLGALRGALLIHYGDTGGTYPPRLSVLAEGGKYIEAIPRQDIPPVASTGNPGHAGFSAVEQAYRSLPVSTESFRNEGVAPWGYLNEPYRAGYGHVFVNCGHRDSKTMPWTRW